MSRIKKNKQTPMEDHKKTKTCRDSKSKTKTVWRQQKHLLSKCPTSKAVKGNVDKFGKYEIWQRRSAPHAVTEIGMPG